MTFWVVDVMKDRELEDISLVSSSRKCLVINTSTDAERPGAEGYQESGFPLQAKDCHFVGSLSSGFIVFFPAVFVSNLCTFWNSALAEFWM